MKPIIFQPHPQIPAIRVGVRALEVLCTMRDAEAKAKAGEDTEQFEELVFEKGAGWMNGSRRVRWGTVKQLLQACAIRADNGSREDFIHYTINETGYELLKAASGSPTPDKESE